MHAARPYLFQKRLKTGGHWQGVILLREFISPASLRPETAIEGQTPI